MLTEFLLMFRLSLTGLILLVIAASCTDPASDIGTDLFGLSQQPQVMPISPTLFAPKNFSDITGQAVRVLTGLVDDPLMGSVSATGYMEFDLGFTGQAPEVIGAEVHLRRTYLYGDSTSMVAVAVHNILEPWSSIGATADTSLTLGAAVTSHTFLSGDTLVVIPMPQEWVDTYADTLESAQADSLFHGLALIPSAGNAIVGFINAGINLHLHSANDTTIFDFRTSVTTTERLTDPVLPEDRIAFQDGSGPSVRVKFDLSGLESRPINGAVFVMHTDTLIVQEAPMHFVRPVIDELNLVAVQEEGEAALLVSTATLSDEGVFVFSGTDMAIFFYQVLFGVQDFLYLELRAPVLANGIGGLVLPDTTAGTKAPVLRLIFGD